MKKVLLLGDSIRQGYDGYVKMAFDGIAKVYSPRENCCFTTYIIRNLLDWKNELKCGADIDLVHWNAGLWDDLILTDEKPLINLEQYAENIDRISYMLKQMFPQAKVIFATSTPVREELFKVYKRYNKDTEAYNKAACQIVIKHGAIVNDLYALLKDMPKEYHSDLTHFNTKEATEIICRQVISYIEKSLDIKAQNLDYNKVFHCNTEPTLGM